MKIKEVQIVTSLEEKDTIIETLANKAQSVLDNNGNITVKLFNDSLDVEIEECISICGDCSELEINFQNAEIRIPSYTYIGCTDIDSYNPIVHFNNLSVEFDMYDEGDC